MNEQMRIEQREADSNSGRLLLMTPDNDTVGHLDYRWVNENMHIDHCEVAPALRGKGLAQTLVQDALRRAREEEFRIQPNCSYVASLFRKWGEAVSDVRL